MPDLYTRRTFLAGALTCGAFSAAVAYFVPGGRPERRREGREITLKLMSGGDATGARDLLFTIWSDLEPKIKVELEPVGSPDTQRKSMIDAAKAKNVDILNLDVIHIPEFANKKLIEPIPLAGISTFVESALKPSKITKDSVRYWAAPFNTDVGMLFSRSSVPTQDQDLETVLDGVKPQSESFVAQLDPTTKGSQEAFVVNVLEHALSHDKNLLDGDGTPSFDSAVWREALTPLKDAISHNKILRTSTEEESREEFGKSTKRKYMRNWPTQYHWIRYGMEGRRLQISSLPYGILGGQSLAVVKGSPHREAALKLIDFLTSKPAQMIIAAHGFAPTRLDVYEDSALKKLIPHLTNMQSAVEGAKPRPIHQNYQDFSDHVRKHVHPFLFEKKSLPDDFADEMKGLLSD